MSNIEKLDEHRSHVEIKTSNGDTHLIPVAVFYSIASGKLKVNQLEDFIPILKEIVAEWVYLKKL